MNEEFEKWWSCTDEDMFQNHTKPEFKAAFLAGAAAMRENCAEVAESTTFKVEIHELMEMTKRDMGDRACHEVADAIRKIEVE